MRHASNEKSIFIKIPIAIEIEGETYAFNIIYGHDLWKVDTCRHRDTGRLVDKELIETMLDYYYLIFDHAVHQAICEIGQEISVC